LNAVEDVFCHFLAILSYVRMFKWIATVPSIEYGAAKLRLDCFRMDSHCGETLRRNATFGV
jgi:hypothetical protein